MKAQRGFSLIELIVGMLIFGILMALAIPAFTSWLRNARVRTAAETVLSGAQLARSEAVRRNTAVRFQLVSTLDDTCALTTDGPNWVISLDDPAGKCATAASDTTAPRIIQSRSGAEGRSAAKLAAGQSALVFNSLGRLTPPPANSVTIDVSNAAGEPCAADGGPVRCLRIMVTIGGQVRMCDPALTSGDAQAC